MDQIFDITDAETNLSLLIAKAETGEDVVIARAGKPVARLIPVKSDSETHLDRQPGFLKDEIWIGPDFEAPLPFWNS